MTFPEWVPHSIAQRVSEYKEHLDTIDPVDKKAITLRAEMWNRLATRPEMEKFWKYIEKNNCLTFSLTANGGLLGHINRYVEKYNQSPLFSPTDYKKEMLEIAKIATSLTRKLKKFSDAEEVGGNPFIYGYVLSKPQIQKAIGLVRPDLIKPGANEAFYVRSALNYYLPNFKEQLESLALVAKNEATDKGHLLPLPRKVKYTNNFRTYFVRVVTKYLITACYDFSPSIIATFCTVALDDPEITSDVVRKISPLDDDTKEFLAAVKSHKSEED